MQFLKTHTGIVILCGVLVVALIGGLAYVCFLRRPGRARL